MSLLHGTKHDAEIENAKTPPPTASPSPQAIVARYEDPDDDNLDPKRRLQLYNAEMSRLMVIYNDHSKKKEVRKEAKATYLHLKKGKDLLTKTKSAEATTNKFNRVMERIMSNVAKFQNQNAQDIVPPAIIDYPEEADGDNTFDKLVRFHNNVVNKMVLLEIKKNMGAYLRGLTYSKLISELATDQSNLFKVLEQKMQESKGTDNEFTLDDIGGGGLSQPSISRYLMYTELCQKYPALIYLDVAVTTICEHAPRIRALEDSHPDQHLALSQFHGIDIPLPILE